MVGSSTRQLYRKISLIRKKELKSYALFVVTKCPGTIMDSLRVSLVKDFLNEPSRTKRCIPVWPIEVATLIKLNERDVHTAVFKSVWKWA